jgi:molybdopterin converting factor small subunit
MKICVKVKVFSQAIPDQVELELEEGSSIETLHSRLKEKLSQEGTTPKLNFLSNTGSLIILLNGMSIYSLSGWETIVREGDEVSFLPMVAGG